MADSRLYEMQTRPAVDRPRGQWWWQLVVDGRYTAAGYAASEQDAVEAGAGAVVAAAREQAMDRTGGRDGEDRSPNVGG